MSANIEVSEGGSVNLSKVNNLNIINTKSISVGTGYLISCYLTLEADDGELYRFCTAGYTVNEEYSSASTQKYVDGQWIEMETPGMILAGLKFKINDEYYLKFGSILQISSLHKNIFAYSKEIHEIRRDYLKNKGEPISTGIAVNGEFAIGNTYSVTGLHNLFEIYSSDDIKQEINVNVNVNFIAT